MQQLTKEQAIKIFESGLWRDMTDEQIVKFQLFQKRLCMPFDVFHGAMTNVLGREIWTHEFANSENLEKEYLGGKPAPSFDEILALIPAGKAIVINS